MLYFMFICTKNYGMRILCLKLHSKAVNPSYVYGHFVIPIPFHLSITNN